MLGVPGSIPGRVVTVIVKPTYRPTQIIQATCKLSAKIYKSFRHNKLYMSTNE